MRATAAEWIDSLFDHFEEMAVPASARDPLGFPGYAEARAEAEGSTGRNEALVVGIGTAGPHQAVAAIFEFAFLGGSMGLAVGAGIEEAAKVAGERGLPLVVVTSTGGARMQEGMAALGQMPRTVAAVSDLGRRGLPRITVLGDPTTGGVYASFASSADYVIAEAGATLGFAGPRVAESISGRPLPAGSQTAEAAMQAGLVDALIPREEVPAMLRRLLAILAPADPSPPSTVAATDSEAVPGQKADAWESFRIARHPGRPSPRRYLESILEDFVELRGDRTGTEDPGVLAAVGRFRGRPVVVATIDRARPGSGGFRKAVRAIETAGRLGFPLVAFVDTPGADPTPESEYGGLAASIARTFESILETPAPVVSIVSGEGGSGGALTLACGDVIGIQQNAVFSVIAPEGAAEILYRDASRASEIARLVKPTAADLVELGLADEIIPEPAGGAHTDPAKAAEFLGSWLERALAEVRADPQKRANRYRG